jgi:hypothetical protein
MSWDDFGAFLHGTGPTNTVLDPDLNPNNILQENLGGSCRVDWSFTGPATPFLDPTTFTVSLYAEAIGPGPDMLVGSVNVPGSAHTPPWNYTTNVAIPPNSLPATGPNASGVYRLTTVITNSIGGQRDQLAGFVDGPVIEMRSP